LCFLLTCICLRSRLFFVWPWSPHWHRTFRDVTQWTKTKSYQVWRI
jgi:hypothetical protein